MPCCAKRESPPKPSISGLAQWPPGSALQWPLRPKGPSHDRSPISVVSGPLHWMADDISTGRKHRSQSASGGRKRRLPRNCRRDRGSREEPHVRSLHRAIELGSSAFWQLKGRSMRADFRSSIQEAVIKPEPIPERLQILGWPVDMFDKGLKTWAMRPAQSKVLSCFTSGRWPTCSRMRR